MKSLKEQREKLLQAKLEEMADIGVKKRTEENTPDFDDPIDLDDDSDSVRFLTPMSAISSNFA